MVKSKEAYLKQLQEGEISPEEAYLLLYTGDKKEMVQEAIVDQSKEEAVAVIGFSCRFPSADNPGEFWENIKNGFSSIKDISSNRWDLDEVFKEYNMDDKQNRYCRKGGFLDNIDQFAAGFFNISDKEADVIDPQQRLLLETAWATLEHAGYSKKSIWGSNTGVFIGAREGSYQVDRDAETDIEVIRAALTGGIGNFNACRLSDYFNLNGPSMVFDTACSSSLVSTHYACQSLLNGECEMALAGGAELKVDPKTYISLNLAKALSSDGKCYVFDRKANGFVPGEGVGIVLLKSYSKAVADGDTIYALIKGSAVNNDGYTMGVTTPDIEGQMKVVEASLLSAGVSPDSISLIEAHGTGTMIGDPIEVKALTRVFEKYTDKKNFCGLGSVKTNIGHLDTAAGIASLIKVILSLHHKKLPPTLNCEEPNPRFRFVDSPFYPNIRLADWEPQNGVRRAGVSAFGFGGTNCHMILEEAPEQPGLTQIHHGYHIMTLSAKTETALDKYSQNLVKYLDQRGDLQLSDICYTLNTGRDQFDIRRVMVVDSLQDLKQKLPTGGLNPAPQTGRGKIAFMFTGQGAQYPGMAEELYHTEPAFRKAMDRCSRLMEKYLGKSAKDLIFEVDRQQLKETNITQPVIFTIDYCLGQMWRSWGVKPNVVLGHSIGEYAAACIAGIFSLEDGMQLVVERGRLMQECCQRGAMAVVFASLDRVNSYLARLENNEQNRVTIAAINGPKNIVISGQEEIIAKLIQMIKDDGLRTYRLEVSHGFHSPMMEPMLQRYKLVLDRIKLNKNQIPIISNVTGEWVEEGVFDTNYWLEHITKPVRFKENIERCMEAGIDILLEVGPGTTLGSMARKIIDQKNIAICSTLSKSQSDKKSVLEAMAEIYLKKVEIDFPKYYSGSEFKKLALPGYPLERKRYWQDQRTESGKVEIPVSKKLGKMIDICTDLTMERAVYQKVFNCENSILRNHKVNGKAVLPGVCYWEMALEAGSSATGWVDLALTEVIHKLPITVEEGKSVTARITIERDKKLSFRIESRQGDEWVENCSGGIENKSVENSARYDLDSIKASLETVRTLTNEEIYAHFIKVGLEYGPLFRTIKEVIGGERETLSKVSTPEQALNEKGYLISPWLTDGILQSVIGITGLNPANQDGTYLPFFAEEVMFWHHLPEECYGYIKLGEGKNDEIIKSNVYVLDRKGVVLARVKGFMLKKYQVEAGSQPLNQSKSLQNNLSLQDSLTTRIAVKKNPNKQLDQLKFFLRKLIAEAADLPIEKVDFSAAFLSVGLDSEGLVNMADRLEKIFNITLFPTVFFEYQTLDKLAKYLYQEFTEQVMAVVNEEKVIGELAVGKEVHDSKFTVNDSDLIISKSNDYSLEINQADIFDDDIAIIGMAGQFPMADNINEFWDNLKNGVDCISDIPTSRWDISQYYSPKKGQEGKTYLRKSGLLKGIAEFDPGFFNISPKEAQEMDPQQRKFMEAAYHAMEHAGYGGKKLYGSKTGVFAGLAYSQYKESLNQFGPFAGLGNHEAILANRFSFFMDFHGPSMVINTLCSSSLVAVHLGCEALKNNDCNYALAGGVFAVLNPNYYIGGSRLQAFSPEGRCKTFDKDADGYVPGEGVAVIMLKKVKDAIRDGDKIHAVIKGSAVNHGGRANNMTAPNAQAQEEVIYQALNNAGVSPDSISYLEAHGTGTTLGDPVELKGLTNAYSRFLDNKAFCAIGSVKTNIGHLEPAAGIAGLIKVVLAMKHRQIPPSINFNKVNPFLDMINTPFFINDRLINWNGETTLRAGVSSFGMGGTNAHLIIEEAPNIQSEVEKIGRPVELFTLSARSEQGLRKLITEYAQDLDHDIGDSLEDICCTAATGRGDYNCRLVVQANDRNQLKNTLHSISSIPFQTGKMIQSGWQYNNALHISNQVAYIFTGEIDVEKAMQDSTLRSLYKSEKVFKEIVDRGMGVLESFNLAHLVQFFTNDDNIDIKNQHEKKVISFIRDVASFELLKYWGIHPEAIHGYGDGEYSASVAADLITLEEGLRLMIKGSIEGISCPAQLSQALRLEGEKKCNLTICFGGINSKINDLDIFKQYEEDRLFVSDFSNSIYPTLLTFVGQLYCLGIDIDWENFYSDESTLKVELPLYPFERTKFWIRYQSAPGETANQKELKVQDRPLRMVQTTFNTDHQERLERLLYNVKWKIKPLAGAGKFNDQGCWLIVNGENKIGNELASRLKTAGQECIVVNTSDDFSPVINSIREQARPFKGIIHLGSLDNNEDGISNLKELNSALNEGVYSLFNLIKTFGTLKQLGDIQLFIVSNYAVRVDEMEAPIHPEKAPVLGLAKVIDIEFPNIEVQCLDIETNQNSYGEVVELLFNELSTNTKDRIAVYRNGDRYVSTLARQLVDTGVRKLPIKDGGVYIVTGGLGGIGLEVSKYLAQKAHVKLIFINRSKLPVQEYRNKWIEDHGVEDSTSQKLMAIKEIEKLGSEVHLITGDIADLERIETEVAKIRNQLGSINGVFHCAGVVRDSMLVFKKREDFEYVLSPKVMGTWVLDKVLSQDSLDLFVMFSSIASITGNFGQGDYAAGNSFMDAYAQKRRMAGKPGITINWSLWKETGMGVDLVKQHMNKGMKALSTSDGLLAMEYALSIQAGQLIVGDLSGLLPENEEEQELIKQDDQGGEDFSGMNAIDFIEETLIEFLCKELDYNKENIDPQLSFMEMGVDSILGISLIQHLGEITSLSFDTTLVFDYPTINLLSEYLVSNYEQDIIKVMPQKVQKQQTLSGLDVKATIIETNKEDNNKDNNELDLDEVEPNDIAVVSLSCRFPGANSVEEYWRLLQEGDWAIMDFPADRFENGESSDVTQAKGGYIDGIYKFEPGFFNITPREAELMDPQQRLLLEIVWEAVERAGYAGKIAGTETGIYVGASNNEYIDVVGELNSFMGTGNALSIIANRISYMLDLKGPSMVIDTACSSSLVAINSACEAIRSGNCEMALAGGVGLILMPYTTIIFNEAGMLSEDNRCKTYDRSADGYVRGEGVGILLLKSLKKALEDGDNIQAVIKGVGINQDGRTNGLTAPNALSQEAVILKAWQQAGINPEDISYIEAHGTGTSLGDPIEIKGLKAAFSKYTDKKKFCAIGSVKTNIGHLEPAAGIAGVIKTILMLKNKSLVPMIHFNQINPLIDINNSPLYISDRTCFWKSDTPRYAGVSAFGFGGTNAHLVLKEAPSINNAGKSTGRKELIVISARNQEAVKKIASRSGQYLKQSPTESNLQNISYTFSSGKKHFSVRIAFLTDSIKELMSVLDQISAAEDLEKLDVIAYSNCKFKKKRSVLKQEEEILQNAIEAWERTGRKSDKRERLLYSLKEAYLQGVMIDWENIYQGESRRIVALPTYPFEKKIYKIQTNQIPEKKESTEKAKKEDSLKTGQVQMVSSPQSIQENLSRELLIKKIAQIFVDELIDKLKLQADDIDLDISLLEYGFDSIFAIQTIKVYEDKVGISLEATLLFDFGTIREFASYLAEEYEEEFQRFFLGDLSDLKENDSIAEEVNLPVPSKNLEKAKPPGTDNRDIAIIGIAGRFPGAKDLDEFWEGLKKGYDGISRFPEKRYQDCNNSILDSLKNVYSGFLDEVSKFDPAFFNISGREAESLDPQQRLFLEIVWKAMENAGYGNNKLSGTNTGVFVGVSTNDYAHEISRENSEFNPYMGTGNAFSVVANRVSYLLNLKGPSVSIDTACSSSLVAVHLACQSILTGESNISIAGGVNLILSVGAQSIFDKAGMLSKDCRCKTFDDSANGYVRGEGVGAVLLKPLAKALEDGDNIYAVIKSTGINQDGSSNGLTVPNASSQTELLCNVWDKAGVSSGTLSYLEAHGTGTSLGDPIEIRGLTQAFRRYTDLQNFCAIGSVKSNIGHLESAAGIAGILKIVLALKHKKIPPLVHFKKANEKINFVDSPFYVNDTLSNWETSNGVPRRAGINSFGFGGTNSHVLFEEAPARRVKTREDDRGINLLAVSAKTDTALNKLTADLYDKLKSDDQISNHDFCYTINTGRNHFNKRLLLFSENKDDLLERLASYVDGNRKHSDSLLLGDSGNVRKPKMVFLYSGQGSQYKDVARKLYHQEKVFRQNLEVCEEVLAPYLEKPLTHYIYSESVKDEILNQTFLTQPIIYSIGYSLTKLWNSWGIKPDVLVGHSIGEYIAATVAGVMSMEDGLKLVAERGRLMQSITEKGSMYAVFAREDILLKELEPFQGVINIAAVNTPENIVLAGKSEVLDQLVKKLKTDGVFSHKLSVSHAFHSPLMDPILDEFKTIASRIKYSIPHTPIVSNITGEIVEDRSYNADYWTRHIASPVRFADSLSTLYKLGYRYFLETGGRQILINMAKKMFVKQNSQVVLLSSLEKGRDNYETMLNSLAHCYIAGLDINWDAYYSGREGSRIALPTYSFEGKRYWFNQGNTSIETKFTKKPLSFKGRLVK